MDESAPRAITLTLSADAALVLDALIANVDEPGRLEIAGPAELQAVWALSASLERVLVDTFRAEYRQLLQQARDRLAAQGD